EDDEEGAGFSSFFGKGGPGKGRQKAPPVEHNISASLEQLYTGFKKKLKIERDKNCESCDGRGGRLNAQTEKCDTCQGSGIKKSYQPMGPNLMEMHSTCTKCGGSGRMVSAADRCSICEGGRITKETKVIEVNVERGLKHGSKIVLTGEGDQTTPQKGDVVVIVSQEEHVAYDRVDYDLYVTLKLTLVEALCGFTQTIRSLDGRILVVRSPAGNVVKPDDQKVLKAEGFPFYRNPYERGDLFVSFKIDMDINIDTSTLSQMEDLLGPRPPDDNDKIINDDAEIVNLQDYEKTEEYVKGSHKMDFDENIGPDDGSPLGCEQS
ncbi:UNVERIFIED_CONTAM: hypothetical protein GTU68_034359, partial [Idotea baltica]|nr:hypothetical protein [Idotea baltica]